MRILLTNDDGINAEGLSRLEKIAKLFSDDVWISAPETEQSGASHSLTISQPLRIRKINDRKFAIQGTPTDSVFVAVRHIINDVKPDLILSGINDGANIAEDITYSGTVAGAIEGTIMGIPSFALSLARDVEEEPFWDTAEYWGYEIIKQLLSFKLDPATLININFPNLSRQKIKGIKITKQGQHTLSPSPLIERSDARGKRYYWIGPGPSHKDSKTKEIDSDLAAISEGFISITPLTYSFNHEPTLKRLMEFFGKTKISIIPMIIVSFFALLLSACSKRYSPPADVEYYDYNKTKEEVITVTEIPTTKREFDEFGVEKLRPATEEMPFVKPNSLKRLEEQQRAEDEIRKYEENGNSAKKEISPRHVLATKAEREKYYSEKGSFVKDDKLSTKEAPAKEASIESNIDDKPGLVFPMKGGNIIKKFGEKTQGNAETDFVSIKGSTRNSTVVAAEAGEVVSAQENLDGFGQMIVIKHSPKKLSTYRRLEKTFVKKGDKVEKNDPIGQCGQQEVRFSVHSKKNRRSPWKATDPMQEISQ